MFGSLRKPSRLIRWDGRRRSSRGGQPLWAHLRRRDVWLRAAIVAVTALAAALLAFCWGPPFPYREGEIYPYDLVVRADFELINQVELVNQPNANPNRLPLPPNGQTSDPAILEKARSVERQPLEKYTKGMVLVQSGTPINERQLAILKEEYRAYRAALPLAVHVRRGISLVLMFGLLTGLVVLYATRFQPAVLRSWRSLIGVCALAGVTLSIGLLASFQPWDLMVLPLTIAAMILTLAYNQQIALVLSITLSLALAVALGSDVAQFMVVVGGLAVMIMLLRNVRTRTQLVKVSCCAGAVFFVMTVASGLMSGQTWELMRSDALLRFFWGSLGGFLLTGLLPVVERVFGVVTDISLREYADGSHPLLQELVRRAPGTYTHSMTVGTLAESAAEAIGANTLLVRVGSYFHDVGKMLKPQYFIENQNGENRHEALEPALSTLIIIGHVKDGVALAQQYNLPWPIVEFVQQHHGTTLVEYFYREALRVHGDNGQNGHAGESLEASYRYPGPKPQTREIGVVMLSDAVESASRALHDPTPTRIRKLVHDLLMKRLLDGQFEESGLTLTELHLIEEALGKSLTALFHARIKYDVEGEKPAVQEKAS